MHYVISYDISGDRLRGAIVRALERHGCRRIQKSVFVGPRLPKRLLARLLNDLTRLTRNRMEQNDSVVVIPLTPEYAGKIEVFGNNNILTNFADPPLFFRVGGADYQLNN